MEVHYEQWKSLQGSCFCGEVQFTVSGDPVGMGYCHCESCRRWAAAPVNAFTLWKPEQLRVTQGQDRVGRFNLTPKSDRHWCKDCGGHVFTNHPKLGVGDGHSAAIPGLPVR